MKIYEFKIIIYFWIKLTSPQAVSAEKWSVRFILALIILSALGVYGMSLAKSMEASPEEAALKRQLVELQVKNEELAKKLEAISSESASLKKKETAKDPDVKGESIADLLVEISSPPTGVQKITSKAGISLIDVYQNPDPASKKIGSLEAKINYPYLEKNNSWYKVVVTSATSGWVNATQVQEVY